MRPCTLRIASAEEIIKATSLDDLLVEHAPWCSTAPAALPTHIKPLMSLRARLLTVVVSLTAIGLFVASVVTYQQLRSFLVDRVDRPGAGNGRGNRPLVRTRAARPGRPRRDQPASAANPGLYVGAFNCNRDRPLGGARDAGRRRPSSRSRASRPEAQSLAAARTAPFTVTAVKGRHPISSALRADCRRRTSPHRRRPAEGRRRDAPPAC